METFIVQPKDEVQIKVLRSILEAFEMPFETELNEFDNETERLKNNPKTAARLDSAIENVNRGNTVAIRRENLWK